jgi:iron-sulfur cluster assembly accessory protein
MRFPVLITKPAWGKMIKVLRDTNHYAFLFSAKGGGCNGFNYHLKAVNEVELTTLFGKNSKIPPTSYCHEDHTLFVDPMSEMILMGTTIDYVQEDYSKQIYESKFTFTPHKELATSCGCGVSFSPRNLD